MDAVLGQPETWTFAAGQQLLAARGCTFAYDAAGNQEMASCAGQTTWYTYDALDRLTSVYIPAIGGIAYAYDALGQRIARRFNGVATRFVWRSGHVLYETTEAGAITRSYTWGIGTDDLVAITNHQDADRRYYVVQDMLRSVRGLVERTGSGGTWRAAWRYTPYGETFTAEGSVNFPVRFRWAGAMLDEETGLYFLRTRSYDPRFGRFIQEDAIGFAGGGNLYAYADGRPTDRRDPDGMVSSPEPQYIPVGGQVYPGGSGSDGCWSDDCSGAWSRGEAWGGFSAWMLLTRYERRVQYEIYRLNAEGAIDEFERRHGHSSSLDPFSFEQFGDAYDAIAHEVREPTMATGRTSVMETLRAGRFVRDGIQEVSTLRNGQQVAWGAFTSWNARGRTGTPGFTYTSSGFTLSMINARALAGVPSWALAYILVHEYLHQWSYGGNYCTETGRYVGRSRGQGWGWECH